MQNNEKDKRIRHATDIHTELMEIVYKMYMTEEVDFHRAMELLREAYSDQLTLINELYPKGGNNEE